MTEGELESGQQAPDWIRKGVELFGASGSLHAHDEFWREDQRIFRMETASAQLQPDLEFWVRQVNESALINMAAAGSTRQRPRSRGDNIEEVHRMSTPEPDGHSLDVMWRIPTSWNRYLEADLEVIFRDRFLAHAMARDPHAARQIHEATGVTLPTLHKWRDPLEVDATWRPWNHKVNDSSHNCKLGVIEEKLIEEALNERSARGEKIDLKLVWMVMREITLETRGSGWNCLCHPWAARFTAGVSRLGLPISAAAKRRTRSRRLHSRAPWMTSLPIPCSTPAI
jgi:hypothetical protein